MKIETIHEFLNEILTVHCASTNNLHSYSASTYDGCMLGASQKISACLELGFISPIPFNEKATLPRREILYQVTKTGAQEIHRLNEYRHCDHKSYKDLQHSSMKRDIALSFVRNFPDYKIEIEYEKILNTKNIKNKRVDIFIKATKRDYSVVHTFLVEAEKKPDMLRTYKEKVLFYDKLIKDGLFQINGLNDRTKILFVCSDDNLSTLFRPQEYETDFVAERLPNIYKSFARLMNAVKNESLKYHRFIPFVEVFKISEPVCRMANDIKVKII